MDINATEILIEQSKLPLNSVLQPFFEQFAGKFDALISVGKILLIVLVVYFIVKIISHLATIKNAHNLSKISTHVAEINKNISLLLEKNAVTKKKK